MALYQTLSLWYIRENARQIRLEKRRRKCLARAKLVDSGVLLFYGIHSFFMSQYDHVTLGESTKSDIRCPFAGDISLFCCFVFDRVSFSVEPLRMYVAVYGANRKKGDFCGRGRHFSGFYS
jgi:hypothetical protein